jgi:hypothetical protein
MRVLLKTSFLSLVVASAACGGAGTGKGVRTDVTKQMSTIQTPVASCYKEALTRSRKTAGTMVLSFTIEPKTGKFKETAVASSTLGDPALEKCVLSEVSKLALAKPQSTVVGIDSYPIRFSPSN